MEAYEFTCRIATATKQYFTKYENLVQLGHSILSRAKVVVMVTYDVYRDHIMAAR